MADPYDLSAAGAGARSAEPASEPKIIIDSDWKQQARAEKEKLAAEERKREEQAGPAGRRPGEPGMPPADFRTLMGFLATQALLYLGAIPDPETGRAIVALDYARHYVDLLALLETKTKGNLEKDEEEELKELLAELRARYIQISRAVANAVAERAAGSGPAGGPASKAAQ